MSNVVLLMVLLLMWILNNGFGLMAELLSFASPKESNQRKGEVAKAGFGL
jgi:hypothetical protein